MRDQCPTNKRVSKTRTYSVQVSTTVTRSNCVHCRADTYAGWFDALPIQYDRHSLSQIGELTALLRGLRTFVLIDGHTHKRKGFSIREHPFPSFGELIREHRCGTPIQDNELRTVERVVVRDDKPDF
jgi:hypothetical protein